ncbi:MAG: glycosyltransferase family 4 protein [Janthinobacterium lividum]
MTKAAAQSVSVCLVSNTAWSIFNYRHGLLRALLAQGATVTVVAPPDRSVEALTKMGCAFQPLAVASKGTNPLRDLRTMWSLYRHYRRIRPDIVFHYTIKPNIFGTLAAALARVPSVAVTTGLGYVFLNAGMAATVAKRLYRLAFRFPREVWFLNPDDREAFERERLLAHPARARLLRGEGIDLDYFSPRPTVADALVRPQPQPFTFLLIGRLLWDKGVGEYIDAARRLREQFPHARWQLLGPVGVANPSAIDQADLDGWLGEGIVDYLGEAADVRPHIAAADCIVLPSYREGVPRTLLEAAAMSKPAIATRVPGCIEVIDAGQTGLLCEARDASALADAMVTMLRMPVAQRAQLGQAARAKAVAEFDQALVIARYFETVGRLTQYANAAPPDSAADAR